jgi:hypothetical protein
MKKDSTKNKAPLAPTSAEPKNAAGAKPRVAMPSKGTLVKKGGAQAGDPYKQPKPARSNIMGKLARGGARYGIRVKFQKTVAPEAGATQAHGRMFAPAVRRQRPNFQDGGGSHGN